MNSTKEKSNLKQDEQSLDQYPTTASQRTYEIDYIALISFSFWHISAIYGLLFSVKSANWSTLVFNSVLYMLTIIGTTAGSHRLWSHRAYKAKLPLQILLMIMQSISCQYTIINWVRDHRLHHKYSDTDPHNARRGFLFSHIGWMVVKKHPEVKKRGRTIDLSDLYSNPVLMFQKKYAIPLLGSCCFVLPPLIPVYCWGESWSNAWHVSVLRFVLSLNAILLINSAAHMWGFKPYDKSILASQNHFASFVSLGEGFHNYHHVFPWDYKAAELGNNCLNLSTIFIDIFAWIGWAYDLKVVPDHVMKQRKLRTGDGTNLWGYEDKDLPKERKMDIQIS